MLLLFIACLTQVTAQADYYYYNGKKIPLTLNENKVCISMPKSIEDMCERILANVQVLNTIKDDTFYIVVISLSDFEKLASLDFWEEYSRSVILTSSYFTEEGREVFSTPYLTVRLKRSQDIDLLTTYAEKYRLRIVGNSQFLPLWYILNVSPESGKSPLECANEMYESGDFSSSVPDLAGSHLDHETAVRSATAEPAKTAMGIYDL